MVKDVCLFVSDVQSEAAGATGRPTPTTATTKPTNKRTRSNCRADEQANPERLPSGRTSEPGATGERTNKRTGATAERTNRRTLQCAAKKTRFDLQFAVTTIYIDIFRWNGNKQFKNMTACVLSRRSNHHLLGRGKCPPTLFHGVTNVRPSFLGRSNCPRFREAQMSGEGGCPRKQTSVPVKSIARSVYGFVLPNSEMLSLASQTVGIRLVW